MASHYLTSVSLEEAKSEYLKLLVQNGMKPQKEFIPVAESAGRIAAGPIYARICAPCYNAGAMDGVALEAKLTFDASEDKPVLLSIEQYKHINTGDPLPVGCDAVIMAEDVTELEDGSIELYKTVAPWQHIRQIGEDICAGEMILPSYSLISPAAIGAMIAGGIYEVAVLKRPVVGMILSGNELAQPTVETKDRDLSDVNSAIFSAMLREYGAETVIYHIAKDDLTSICKALEIAITECDIVIVNTGLSISGEDYAATAIAQAGDVLHHGLAIKPGKPTTLGYYGAKPLVGVPGYPVSGIIVIEQILRPIIEYFFHRPPECYRYADAVLLKNVVSTPEYLEFVRVRLGYVKNRLIASPLGRGSGIVTSFMKADGIVEIPRGVGGYESGKKISVRLLRDEDDLRRSLVAIGSHDPLLDELTELLRLEYGDVFLGSAHVGSMSGLYAILREEAHLAGIHLLNEKTGEYNVSFVRKVFPKGGVRLVECVKRSQGLILQKGNPKSIMCIADLAQNGLSYVNRQKGSGTRILIDYLCRVNGIDTSKIYGYQRMEYTHTSVAALIAAGSADAGLGVYSVAKLYDLDFVPICQEQYDLLIPDHAWDSPMIQNLMSVMKSDAFKSRIEDLGGYVFENPGTVREVF